MLRRHFWPRHDLLHCIRFPTSVVPTKQSRQSYNKFKVCCRPGINVVGVWGGSQFAKRFPICHSGNLPTKKAPNFCTKHFIYFYQICSTLPLAKRTQAPDALTQHANQHENKHQHQHQQGFTITTPSHYNYIMDSKCPNTQVDLLLNRSI